MMSHSVVHIFVLPPGARKTHFVDTPRTRIPNYKRLCDPGFCGERSSRRRKRRLDVEASRE